MDKELAELILGNLTTVSIIDFFKKYAEARISWCNKALHNARSLEEMKELQGRISELKFLAGSRQMALDVRDTN